MAAKKIKFEKVVVNFEHVISLTEGVKADLIYVWVNFFEHLLDAKLNLKPTPLSKALGITENSCMAFARLKGYREKDLIPNNYRSHDLTGCFYSNDDGTSKKLLELTNKALDCTPGSVINTEDNIFRYIIETTNKVLSKLSQRSSSPTGDLYSFTGFWEELNETESLYESLDNHFNASSPKIYFSQTDLKDSKTYLAGILKELFVFLLPVIEALGDLLVKAVEANRVVIEKEREERANEEKEEARLRKEQIVNEAIELLKGLKYKIEAPEGTLQDNVKCGVKR